MAKDRFKATTERKTFRQETMPQRFAEGIATRLVAQAGTRENWNNRISNLLSDERLTPEARAMLKYWLTIATLSPAQTRLIHKLEVWRALSKKQGQPTFGGTHWAVDPEGDARRKGARLAEKNAKRPDWMRDASKLPLKPPGKK
jgi:hypothetical protein